MLFAAVYEFAFGLIASDIAARSNVGFQRNYGSGWRAFKWTRMDPTPISGEKRRFEVAFPICQLMEAKGPRSISFVLTAVLRKDRRLMSWGAQNMNNIVGRSAGWGAIFGAAAAFASGLCLAIFWSTARTGHAGDFTMLMILWVPPVAIMGGGAAAVLFGVVAVIVNFSPGTDRSIAHKLCRLGESSVARNNHSTFRFMGCGWFAPSLAGSARNLFAVACRSPSRGNRGLSHRVDGAVGKK